MRLVIDVTPLSHPRTGLGNYITVRSAGPRGGGRRRARARGLRAGQRPPAGGRWRTALDRIPLGRASPRLPPSRMPADDLEPARRPACEQFVGALDVLHFRDWMYPPQRGGLRSTMIHDLVPLHFPPWVHAHAPACTGEVPSRGASRPTDRRQLEIHRGADVDERSDFPREGSPSPIRESTRGSAPAAPAELGRPYVLTVATLEPRKNDRRAGRVVSATSAAPSSRSPSAGRRAGATRHSTWTAASPSRLRPRRRAPPALPRRERSSPTRRSSRASGVPVVEAMACGTPCRGVRASVARRGVRRRRRASRPGRRPRRSRTRSSERCASATSSSPRGLEHARASRGGAVGAATSPPGSTRL